MLCFVRAPSRIADHPRFKATIERTSAGGVTTTIGHNSHNHNPVYLRLP
jgi:hypothetical protein